MAAEAKSSKGVAMYLSVGDAEVASVKPTAIIRGNPTGVTAPPPVPGAPPPIGIATIVKAAATVLTCSSADYARFSSGATMEFAGFPTEWDDCNGTQVVTKIGAPANAFTIPVDSSAYVSAAPAGVSIAATFPSTPGEYKLGEVVVCRDTGFNELDDKYFIIAEVTVDGFTLLGADTRNSTGILNAALAEMQVYDNTDLVRMCLNNFAFALETPGTIAAGTYCNPQATLPAIATGVGTATLGGWIDKDDPAYVELLKAEDDGLKRVFSIVLPLEQGEIVSALVITGVTWDIPLEGGMAFTATANLSAKPRHLF